MWVSQVIYHVTWGLAGDPYGTYYYRYLRGDAPWKVSLGVG